MGAEALCRGAAIVVGIEQSPRACTVIEQNWQQVVKPEQTYQLLRGDVMKRLEKLSGQQFDHIYFDPPYASELYVPVLNAIATLKLLAPDGELAVEHRPKLVLPDVVPHLSLTAVRQKRYGSAALTFYSAL
jgi:16S rRNA (guanine(966)-N(2))-methyltransferase RsmD